MTMPLPQRILQAEQRIRMYVRETPLEHSLILSHATGCQVYLKQETFQYTGAFKVRGAFNKILMLNQAQQQKGIVAASSGNHGAAVAYAAYQLKLKAKIFVPENASQAKIDNILQYGAELELYGNDCLIAEERARAYANEHQQVYISPYNDIDVIAGQGTLGVELARQLDSIDIVLVPVGGGGLIAGIGTYLKSANPEIKLYGCQPLNSPVMTESIKQGHIIEMDSLPTLSDATAGNIESDTVTFDLCKHIVDDYFLLNEEEICHALYEFIHTQRQLIEGAAALTVAALLKYAPKWQGKNVILILSGRNISIEALRTAI